VHEDFFVASGTLESGAIFQTSANWRSPIKRREVKIYGTKGTLDVDLLDMSVGLDRPGNVNVIWEEQKRLSGNSVGDSIVFGVQKNEPLMAELGQFAEFVKSGDPGQLCSLEDAKSLIELLENS
jgi:predicted dehydrogenase